MSKYYLLSDNDKRLTAVSPNKRGRNSDYSLETSINIQNKTAEERWISAGDESYFRISTLPDIMYLYNSRLFERFAPLYIHEVDVKNDEKLLDDEIGHHDGASSFSLYEGKYASSVLITKTYDLSQKEDLDQLIALGFFDDDEGRLFRGGNLNSYFEWLVACNQQALFTYLYDKEPDFSILLYIVMENRTELLAYIIDKSVSDEEDEYILEDYNHSIENALEYAVEKDMHDIVQILLPHVPKKIKSLTSGLYAAIDANNQELVEHFIEQLIRVYAHREILDAVHYATPKEKLHLLRYFYPYIFHRTYIDDSMILNEWAELMNLALACDNDELLSQLLTDSVAEISTNMDNMVRLTKQVEEEVKSTNPVLKEMVKQGNIIACQIILENVPDFSPFRARFFKRKPSGDLDGSLLIAAENGHLGIVKLLIEHGADAKTWMNYPIKFANKHNYTKMKKYLLELGVPDERFK